MNIKRGHVVSHAGAVQWGAGKVLEVEDLKATIQFSDGIIRKIASSHYFILQPADPNSFVPIPVSVAVAKIRVSPRKVKNACSESVEKS
jgi:hypothetical protein